jgi:YD repeat-containing protein
VYGRTTDATDVRGNHTATGYTPASGGPVTKVTTTTNPTGTQNPLNWVSYMEIAPGYGNVTGSVDINNRRTDTTYDPLGRTTAQWLPNRTKGTDSANATVSYAISNSVPSVVTTSKLIVGGAYLSSYAFYDGLLRPRQTQTIAAGGGRVITDAFYNSLGETVKASGPYYNGAAGPSTTLFPTPLDQNVPSQTTTAFDGAGRATTSTFLSMGAPQWTSTTAYGGDRTDVTPPTDGEHASGGTPTSTYTDALGHTIEVRQYAGLTPDTSGPTPTTCSAGRRRRQTRTPARRR